MSKIINDYLEALGIEELVSINFKENLMAPTSVTHDPKTGTSRMNIKLPCNYKKARLLGVLDHEIGTHFLRKYNEQIQVWHKNRK